MHDFPLCVLSVRLISRCPERAPRSSRRGRAEGHANRESPRHRGRRPVVNDSLWVVATSSEMTFGTAGNRRRRLVRRRRRRSVRGTERAPAGATVEQRWGRVAAGQHDADGEAGTGAELGECRVDDLAERRRRPLGRRGRGPVRHRAVPHRRLPSTVPGRRRRRRQCRRRLVRPGARRRRSARRRRARCCGERWNARSPRRGGCDLRRLLPRPRRGRRVPHLR